MPKDPVQFGAIPPTGETFADVQWGLDSLDQLFIRYKGHSKFVSPTLRDINSLREPQIKELRKLRKKLQREMRRSMRKHKTKITPRTDEFGEPLKTDIQHITESLLGKGKKK
jgi:hypothetical protein